MENAHQCRNCCMNLQGYKSHSEPSQLHSDHLRNIPIVRVTDFGTQLRTYWRASCYFYAPFCNLAFTDALMGLSPAVLVYIKMHWSKRGDSLLTLGFSSAVKVESLKSVWPDPQCVKFAKSNSYPQAANTNRTCQESNSF